MVQINTDRTVRVRVDTEALPWSPSPTQGVERRMLERDGGEVARATSLVRFAKGSAFPEHEHGGGEEFLVLDGVFSDEEGDFPAGWYVRNPPGSRHSPRSGPGCTIFVKLRQMADDDRQTVRIDTRNAAPSRIGDGVGEIRLFTSPGEQVRMLVLDPGATWTFEPIGTELFVLEGQVSVDGAAAAPGTWLRVPTGEPAELVSEAGARIFVKAGHLGSPDLPHAA